MASPGPKPAPDFGESQRAPYTGRALNLPSPRESSRPVRSWPGPFARFSTVQSPDRYGIAVANTPLVTTPSSRPRFETFRHPSFFPAFALCVLLCWSIGCGHLRAGSLPTPISVDADELSLLESLMGRAHTPRPLSQPVVPAHPYMAANGASSMHVDSYTTNTYAWSGPLGHQPEVASRAMGILGGECPTINFDRLGRIVTVCVSSRTPHLVLLEPHTLKVLSTYELPARRTSLLSVRKAMQDTSGGAYFYLDQLDRAVVGTADGAIEVIAIKDGAPLPELVLQERIELQTQLRLPDGELDKITAVMPDYDGNYWFVGRSGTVGAVTPMRRVLTTRLNGEEIENSFSTAPDGTYLVSDHAMYRFELDPVAGPRVVWRQAYDRGDRRKIGQINQGSGTTPTLLGDDYVILADNAEPRMNVLVLRRGRNERERLVCQVPVFRAGQSATENTLVAHGRSLIVENNAGYDIFTTMRGGKTSAPGLARIDIREDESGCDLIWESQEISQTTVPKLSTANGLIYAYTKLPEAPNETDAYYFTAIDFETGKTVYRVLTGTGMRWDNNWASISLAPDGTAFVGVLNGLIRVRDTQPSTALSSDHGAAL